MRKMLTILFMAMLALGGLAATAGAQVNNPGSGCNGEAAPGPDCLPDPGPGQDCDPHGNNPDGNEDHCTPDPTATPTPPVLTPTPEPTTPTPTETPSPGATPDNPTPGPAGKPLPRTGTTGAFALLGITLLLAGGTLRGTTRP